MEVNGRAAELSAHSDTSTTSDFVTWSSLNRLPSFKCLTNQHTCIFNNRTIFDYLYTLFMITLSVPYRLRFQLVSLIYRLEREDVQAVSPDWAVFPAKLDFFVRLSGSSARLGDFPRPIGHL